MTVPTRGIGVESKLKSEELLRVTCESCAHAKKLPNYPKIRFSVKSDTGDELETQKLMYSLLQKKLIYSNLQIIKRIMKKL